MCYRHPENFPLNCWERHAKLQPQDLSRAFSFQEQWIIVMRSPWMSVYVWQICGCSIPAGSLYIAYIHSISCVWIHFYCWLNDLLECHFPSLFSNCAKEVGSMFQINVREDVYLIMCTFFLVVYTREMSLHVTNPSINPSTLFHLCN